MWNGVLFCTPCVQTTLEVLLNPAADAAYDVHHCERVVNSGGLLAYCPKRGDVLVSFLPPVVV